MSARKTLIVVMPVYNEEAAISAVLEKWIRKLNALDFEYGFQIHVYNDGSKDRTKEILEECAAEYPEQIVVHNKPNSGHGATILQGYRENAPNAEWLFQVDSDDEMGPEDFDRLWKLREDNDFVVGARSGRKQAWPRYVVSLISRLTVRTLFGKTVHDVNTPYRLMRSSAFQELFAQISDSAFAPNVILSGMAARKKLRYAELQVPQRDRQTGQVSLRKWSLFKAAVKSFIQTVQHGLQYGRGLPIFIGVAILSVLLRLWAGCLGWNFDFDSYQIVAEIVEKGKCVYAETYRYNYGPIWFYVLRGLKLVFGIFFREGLILFLSCCDIGIAAVLWKKRYRFAALLFLLSPLTIYTSGYHNQFDNFAVLAAMLSVLALPPREEDHSTVRVLLGSIMLGFSLMIKHIFIFYSFWLFLHYSSLRKKFLVLLIPATVFACGFLPYILPEMTDAASKMELRYMSKQLLRGNVAETFRYAEKYFLPTRPACRGIWWSVVRYRSFDNRILHTWFLPNILRRLIPVDILFFAGIILSGFLFRKSDLFSSLLSYTGLLLVLAFAITNQYLAIPAAFAATVAFPFGIMYHMLGLILLDSLIVWSDLTYLLAVLLLCLIFLQRYRKEIRAWGSRIFDWLDKISFD